MDTSYHLGWQTQEALYEKLTGNCDLFQLKCLKLSKTLQGLNCISTHYNQLENVHTLINSHKKQCMHDAQRSFRRFESSVNCWVSESSSSVVLMSSRMCKLDIYLLFRTTRGTEILSVINSKMALNLFALVHAQHTCVCALRVFDKVLCIEVTITFITDVVYIFDILMFILFCEERVHLGKSKSWWCVSIGTAQGLIFAL